MNMRMKRSEDLMSLKVANYIFEGIQENLVTSSSTVKEVSARIDISRAVLLHFISCVGKEQVRRSYGSYFPHYGFIQRWRYGIRPTVKMSYWKCTSSKITKFSCVDNSLQRYNENKDCEEAVVEQTVAKHQRIRKAMRMTCPIMKE
jgi:hypothetical protein